MQGKGEAGEDILASCNCGSGWMGLHREEARERDPASTSPKSAWGRSATRLYIDTEVAGVVP